MDEGTNVVNMENRGWSIMIPGNNFLELITLDNVMWDLKFVLA